MINLSKTILAVLIISSAVSCKQSPASRQADTENTVSDTLSLQDAAQDKVLTQYLSLKDALVASDIAEIQKTALPLASALNNADLKKAAQLVDSLAKSGELAEQRSYFNKLNDQLIPVFKKAVLAKGSFYVQYCPMANQGTGGYWLAAEQEVRNPYYGDEMLNCGEVTETIK